MTDETPERRLRRERNRILFDGVASLYDATRQRYPLDVVHELLTTGQLTSRLAGRGLRITAVDIGAEMVRLARRNVVDRDVSFHCASFALLRPGVVGAAHHRRATSRTSPLRVAGVLVSDAPSVEVVQETSLAMAPALRT
ncbi:MAG TPA: methyltransferase domain-containing protein [Mycobacteriales bacterium]|nr:methyltransferase domain-containing protein [Mycobacteriales bacterium]